MWKRPGRRGRPFERAEEAELFHLAFPDKPDEVRAASKGEGMSGEGASVRWEAAVELARRALSAPIPRPDPIRDAKDVFERFRYLIGDDPVEVFAALLLDVKHREIEEVVVSRGVLDGSLIHPREVFAPAIEKRAAAVIAVHNHPSGDPAPSAEDREVTRRLRAAGEIVGIPLLDHVIIGERSFHSFREGGDW